MYFKREKGHLCSGCDDRLKLWRYLELSKLDALWPEPVKLLTVQY